MLWIVEQVDSVSWPEISRFVPALSRQRRAAVLSLKPEGPRVQTVLAELLLRRALWEEAGLGELPRLETGEKGKPFFPDRQDLQFSLSHCKTTVACGLDSAPLGVDAECCGRLRRTGSPGTAPSLYRVLSDAERAWTEAGETFSEQDRRFTALWTCKEAWGKARGLGILYDLKTTEFLPASEPWRQYGLVFQLLPIPGGWLTICAGRVLPVRRLTVPELLSGMTEVS